MAADYPTPEADPVAEADLAAHVAAADPHPGYQKESEKGAANGYASLDGTGNVPASQLANAPSGGGGGGADASSTVKGISKLSVDPAVAANPIAVGDNDPRNTNQRVPTDGSVTNAKVAAGAGIAKSKLAPLAIVDADVDVAAAISQAKIAGLAASLAAKADLASPALTGTPTVPTAAQGTNTTQAASTAYVQTETGLLIPKSLVDAKGDLLVGTADNTVGRLAVGTNGQVLTADSAQASGVKWATPAAGGGSGASGKGARVTVAQNLSILVNTTTTLAFSASRFDTDTMFNAAGTALTGTVAKASGTSTLTGTGTAFTTELAVGDFIKVGTEVAQVSVITSDTALTVNYSWTATASGVAATKLATRITCKTAGIYMCTFRAYVSGLISGDNVDIRIRLNGATLIDFVRMTAQRNDMQLLCAAPYQLAVNDYLEAQVTSPTSTQVQISQANNISPEFSVIGT